MRWEDPTLWLIILFIGIPILRAVIELLSKKGKAPPPQAKTGPPPAVPEPAAPARVQVGRPQAARPAQKPAKSGGLRNFFRELERAVQEAADQAKAAKEAAQEEAQVAEEPGERVPPARPRRLQPKPAAAKVVAAKPAPPKPSEVVAPVALERMTLPESTRGAQPSPTARGGRIPPGVDPRAAVIASIVLGPPLARRPPVCTRSPYAGCKGPA